MDRRGALPGTHQHCPQTARLRVWRGSGRYISGQPRAAANPHRFGDNSCSGTPGRAPGDLFSSFGCQPPPLRVRARPAESSGCGRGWRACGRAAQPPSRPPTHPRIPRLRRLAARPVTRPLRRRTPVRTLASPFLGRRAGTGGMGGRLRTEDVTGRWHGTGWRQGPAQAERAPSPIRIRDHRHPV